MTGTVRLKAVFENEDSSLFPNQFVNARLLVDTQRNADVAHAIRLSGLGLLASGDSGPDPPQPIQPMRQTSSSTRCCSRCPAASAITLFRCSQFGWPVVRRTRVRKK